MRKTYSTSQNYRIVFLAQMYTIDNRLVLHIEQEELVNGGIIFG